MKISLFSISFGFSSVTDFTFSFLFSLLFSFLFSFPFLCSYFLSFNFFSSSFFFILIFIFLLLLCSYFLFSFLISFSFFFSFIFISQLPGLLISFPVCLSLLSFSFGLLFPFLELILKAVRIMSSAISCLLVWFLTASPSNNLTFPWSYLWLSISYLLF